MSSSNSGSKLAFFGVAACAICCALPFLPALGAATWYHSNGGSILVVSLISVVLGLVGLAATKFFKGKNCFSAVCTSCTTSCGCRKNT